MASSEHSQANQPVAPAGSSEPGAMGPAALASGLSGPGRQGEHPIASIEQASDPEPLLDAEKLICYDLALELQVLCATLVPAGQRVLKDQLDRASLSIICNIAEGAGRRSRKEKRRYYTIARGSATEIAALVDVLRLRRLAPPGACKSTRSHALRVVQLLTKLDAALR
jgi:four helix bundle protein